MFFIHTIIYNNPHIYRTGMYGLDFEPWNPLTGFFLVIFELYSHSLDLNFRIFFFNIKHFLRIKISLYKIVQLFR